MRHHLASNPDLPEPIRALLLLDRDEHVRRQAAALRERREGEAEG